MISFGNGQNVLQTFIMILIKYSPDLPPPPPPPTLPKKKKKKMKIKRLSFFSYVFSLVSYQPFDVFIASAPGLFVLSENSFCLRMMRFQCCCVQR